MLIKKFQIKKSEEKDKKTTRIRNKNWDDQSLEEALRNCNRQGLQRTRILSFMVCILGEHAWSLRSLDRTLCYFNIHRNDSNVSVEVVKSVLNKERMGPGRLLGYPAQHLKIKNIHRLMCHETLYMQQ